MGCWCTEIVLREPKKENAITIVECSGFETSVKYISDILYIILDRFKKYTKMYFKSMNKILKTIFKSFRYKLIRKSFESAFGTDMFQVEHFK